MTNDEKLRNIVEFRRAYKEFTAVLKKFNRLLWYAMISLVLLSLSRLGAEVVLLWHLIN